MRVLKRVPNALWGMASIDYLLYFMCAEIDFFVLPAHTKRFCGYLNSYFIPICWILSTYSRSLIITIYTE